RSSFLHSHDTPTTAIYTLSLHDALPIYRVVGQLGDRRLRFRRRRRVELEHPAPLVLRARQADDVDLLDLLCVELDVLLHLEPLRSEEHTSELQSRSDLVCRLLLEKKKRR